MTNQATRCDDYEILIERNLASVLAEDGHAEIAEILGVPEGTVWRRLHDARKALRQIL